MIFMKMKVLKLWIFAFLLILSLGCLCRICVVANQALELANNPNFAFWGAFFDTSDVIYFLGLIPICILSIKTICSYIKEANSFYASEREIRNSNKTTVDGILDSKTKSEMDKDGDGKIMISEYYPLSEEKGLKTEGDLLDDKEMNCPNCGAVLDLDSNGICAYCHTVIPSGKYGWVLIDMKSIQLLGE